MASRYEESARLLRKMATEGFKLIDKNNKKLITHKNKTIFKSWGFISEESPFLQLKLVDSED